MRANIHNAVPTEVLRLENGTVCLTLKEPEGGEVNIFLGKDFTLWDEIVAKMEQFRGAQEVEAAAKTAAVLSRVYGYVKRSADFSPTSKHVMAIIENAGVLK
ncbi:hypothetical protein FDI14_gp049 [Mycobacterium phage SirDuracell]|uniref:Uncharacterized protein n=1 Tax=Mycobacterium phage SirDuracell TaxID=1034116 RepID=G1D5R4_9CAUD|nr:hypothetical protein FDI14_gp049 [Mycobacterium phage SirDuracell]AEK10114.1 hypothetical protein PBI_SIRDURACELL_49 [Mycobacterium phage SirDuracell]